MKRLLSFLIIVLLSAPALAGDEAAEHADLYAAIKEFDRSYATNDVDTYFGYYADGATVFFYGARVDIAAYYEEWTAMMEAGGGVEKNEMSDLQVQVLPCGEVAIATAFIDNVTRAPDGAKTAIRAFETDVWQKIDGEWKIISLHYTDLPAEE